MERIEDVLKQEFKLEVRNAIDHLYANDDIMLALVVAPHNGNDYRYLVRVSTRAAFDRWANSRAIEKEFDTVDDVCNYLKENKTAIYRQLLEYLSNEYESLNEEFSRELC